MQLHGKRDWLFLSLIVGLFWIVPQVIAYEIDEVVKVTEVIDGDSFYVTGDEVRLADVSAAEWNQPGGSEATQALTELIEGEIVYLDTDQKTGRGPYGRLIAVVYIPLNETHYVNVNKLLLELDVVELTDYTNNEFNPDRWTVLERYAWSEQPGEPQEDDSDETVADTEDTSGKTQETESIPEANEEPMQPGIQSKESVERYDMRTIIALVIFGVILIVLRPPK